MNNYEEQICKAIDIILKKRFADLKFNKTIFATITKSKGDGLYELKYQDAVIEAYSLTGLKYKENDNVYVLIQNNVQRLPFYYIFRKNIDYLLLIFQFQIIF